MSAMDRILGFDESYGIVTAESGAILQDMQTYLGDIGYQMPIDLGAKGSC